MEVENSLLLDVEAFVTNFITEQVAKEYAFHDVDHTSNVVKSVKEIGKEMDLSDKELEILELAAWFHDTGYDKGSIDHEERSCKYAKEYLENHKYNEADLQKVLDGIRATKLPHNPKTVLEKIICDADLSHLGKSNYWDRCGRVRQELTITKKLMMSEQEWLDFELEFITSHEYKTDIANQLYGKVKNKHIRQLRKQQLRLNPNTTYTVEEFAKLSKKKHKRRKKKKKKKNIIAPNGLSSRTDETLNELDLGRGVETMYRTTYRTHVNLSSIADNKANIMISVNAILISVIISILSYRNISQTQPMVLLPVVIFLVTGLSSLICAVLSIRPKVTSVNQGPVKLEEAKKNVVFFGNFINLDLEEFEAAMDAVLRDGELLYGT